MDRLKTENEKKLSETMNCTQFLNRKSIELLKSKEVSPIHKRYKKILEDRLSKREHLRSVIVFERLMKDPEDINPSFQPNAKNGQNKKRKLSKAELKSFLVSNEIWLQRKQERIKQKMEK